MISRHIHFRIFIWEKLDASKPLMYEARKQYSLSLLQRYTFYNQIIRIIWIEIKRIISIEFVFYWNAECDKIPHCTNMYTYSYNMYHIYIWIYSYIYDTYIRYKFGYIYDLKIYSVHTDNLNIKIIYVFAMKIKHYIDKASKTFITGLPTSNSAQIKICKRISMTKGFIVRNRVLE